MNHLELKIKNSTMKKLPLIVFCVMMISAFCTGVHGYCDAECRIAADVNNALAQTLARMPAHVVSADTIRCYRGYLTITELRDTACLSLRTVRRRDRLDTELVADANCGFMTVLKLSDQRASGALLGAGLLWLLGSLWYQGRRRPKVAKGYWAYGGLVYSGHRFVTASGQPIKLTPMQHSLLEMFMRADGHTLSKQEICQRLWPKKPNASDTLYTLIRRTKPVIEGNSDLRIESDRGVGYTLTFRRLGD